MWLFYHFSLKRHESFEKKFFFFFLRDQVSVLSLCHITTELPISEKYSYSKQRNDIILILLTFWQDYVPPWQISLPFFNTLGKILKLWLIKPQLHMLNFGNSFSKTGLFTKWTPHSFSKKVSLTVVTFTTQQLPSKQYLFSQNPNYRVKKKNLMVIWNSVHSSYM